MTYHIHFRQQGTSIGDVATINWFEYRRMRAVWKGSEEGPAVLQIHPGLLGFKWQEIQPRPRSG